jgi:hypothetical protein
VLLHILLKNINIFFILGQVTKATLSLTSALDGVGAKRHAPGRFTPGNDRYPLYRRLGGPQGQTGRVRKISPPTGIRSPEHQALSESLYRLSYPGPHINKYTTVNLMAILLMRYTTWKKLTKIIIRVFWQNTEDPTDSGWQYIICSIVNGGCSSSVCWSCLISSFVHKVRLYYFTLYEICIKWDCTVYYD